MPPRKAQAEITSFTSKWVDNKLSPRRSYTQIVSENPYECLSGNEDEDKIMDEAESCTSSEATQKTDNAQVSQSSDQVNEGNHQHSPSKKMQRKVAKAAKTSSKHLKDQQIKFLSSATRASLERAREAEDLLINTPDNCTGDNDAETESHTPSTATNPTIPPNPYQCSRKNQEGTLHAVNQRTPPSNKPPSMIGLVPSTNPLN
jgi:hypothetical protein